MTLISALFATTFGRIMAAIIAGFIALKVNNAVVGTKARVDERSEIVRKSNETAIKRDTVIRKDRKRRRRAPTSALRKRMLEKYARGAN